MSNIIVERTKEPNKFDLNFFSNIATEEQAYWFGVLSNRGHLTNRALYLNLNIKDWEHLYRFRTAIKGTQSIYRQNYGKTAMLTITSRPLVEMLCDYGFSIGKSCNRSFPPFDKVPLHLQQPFIRGLYDSGSTLVHKDHKWQGTIVFTGTKDILEHLNYTIFSKCDASYSTVKLAGVSKVSYSVSWGGQVQAAKILSWVYNDSRIHLPRKYNAYENLRQSVEHRYGGKITDGKLFIGGQIANTATVRHIVMQRMRSARHPQSIKAAANY